MKRIELIFDHVDGLSNLYLIDVRGVTRIDRHVSDGTVLPVINSNTYIYKLPVLEDFSYTENSVTDERGTAYKVEIHGFIPRIGQAYTIQQLESGEWLALIQDANGDILLCGSRDVPLTFSGEKGAGSGRNGTTFKLSGVEPDASAVVSENSMATVLSES